MIYIISIIIVISFFIWVLYRVGTANKRFDKTFEDSYMESEFRDKEL